MELKKGYQQITAERHKSIEKTKGLEDRIKECNKSIPDLEQRQEGLNASWERLRVLEGCFCPSPRKGGIREFDRAIGVYF